MKNVAIIGLGSHVKKNIIPAFSQLGWKISYFLVRDIQKYAHDFFNGAVITDNLATILADKTLDFVYVATPISTHFFYSKVALEQGHNVICEKPATVTVFEFDELKALSLKMKRKFYQVEMFKYHRQFHKLKEILATREYGDIRQATFSFKIPHLPSSDIRYNPELCGGALFDVGFYPLSSALALFPHAKLLNSVCYSEPGYAVDLSGVALLELDNNALITCQWAIGSCYENKITLDFPMHRLTVDRAFSKPPSYISSISILSAKGEHESVDIGCDDQFVNMLSNFGSKPQLLTESDDSTRRCVTVMETIVDNYRAAFTK